MINLTNSILRYRKVVIVITVIITAFFGFFIKDIRVNSDILSSLPDDDSTAVLFNRIGDEYGGNDIAMIALETDDIFRKDIIQVLRQITDSIKTIDGIGSVTSLTDVIDIKSNEEGIEVGKLIDVENLPATREELDRLKKYIYSKDLYKGTLVSEDTTATLVIAKIITGADKESVTDQIRSKIQRLELPDHVKIYYGGFPFMFNEAGKIIVHDVIYLGIIAFVVIALILFVSFRSKPGVFLPLLTVLITIIWTLGIMSLMGYQLTMITSIIPVILLAVGSAWPIHILNRINRETDSNRQKAITRALLYVALPVTLAAFAAIMGFLTFVFGSYLTMIKQFGVFSAIGILIALNISLVFIPALTASLKPQNKQKNTSDEPPHYSVIDKFLNLSLKYTYTRPVFIILPWTIVLLVASIGITKIRHNVDLVEYFKKESDVRKTERLLQKKFTGSLPVYVTVKGNVQSPDVLNVMKEIQEYMEENPCIRQSQSVADLIMELNEAMGEGKKIPDDQAKVEQLWFMLLGQDIMKQVVNESLTEGLVQANMSTSDNATLTEFSENLSEFIQKYKDYQIEISGIPSLYLRLDESIVQTQKHSLFLAIILAFLLVALVFRSVKKGLLSIIPMTVSIIVLYGFMGWAGIPIDIATVLVASISIGVGDYAIHIISGFNHYYLQESDAKNALTKSLQISGRAVIINVLSVAAGFIALVFSDYVPLQRFGILVVVAIMSSGLAAVTLLPMIMKATQRTRITAYNKKQLKQY